LQLDGDTLRVTAQVKLIRGVAIFAPPKGNKERDVPLPSSVASALRLHMENHPPVGIKLPWARPDGPLTERRLIFTNTADGIVWRSNFNIQEWKPALAAAGLIPTPEPGSPTPPPGSTECTPFATSTPRSSWTRARASKP
jgi:integrase